MGGLLPCGADRRGAAPKVAQRRWAVSSGGRQPRRAARGARGRRPGVGVVSSASSSPGGSVVPGQVPAVELAHVSAGPLRRPSARRASAAKAAISSTTSARSGRGRATPARMSPKAHGLPSAPRPTATAAQPVSSSTRRASPGRDDVAAGDDRHGHGGHDLGRDAVVGACPRTPRPRRAGGSRARRRRRRRGAGRSRPGVASWGVRPRRIFTVTGMSTARTIASTIARRPRGVGQQRRAGAGLADLGHRAAHVDVDQVGAGRLDGPRGLGHRVRRRRRRPARPPGARPGAIGEHARGLAVGVADAEARDHLATPPGRRRGGATGAGRPSWRCRPAAPAPGGSRSAQAARSRTAPPSGRGRGEAACSARAASAARSARMARMRFFTARLPARGRPAHVQLVDDPQPLQREQRLVLVDLQRVAADQLGQARRSRPRTPPRPAPP